jgi:quercetin dioxygenase-like cupin family protein
MMSAAGASRYDVRHTDIRRWRIGLAGRKFVAHSTELPGSAPVTPPTLVAYQAGAVVSRTLLKRGGGTVTVFAFDEGQSLSEHTAPFDAIAHVLEGEALITIAGAPLTVRAGEMVLLPANQPHAVHAPSRFKMLLTMIRSA